MSVLADRDIRAALEDGRIRIDPYDPVDLQPSSVDLRLDRSFRLRTRRPAEVKSGGDQGAARYCMSVERFGLPRLCNNWTGELLDAAGLPGTPMLHLPPQGLLLDLRWRAGAGRRRQRATGRPPRTWLPFCECVAPSPKWRARPLHCPFAV